MNTPNDYMWLLDVDVYYVNCPVKKLYTVVNVSIPAGKLRDDIGTGKLLVTYKEKNGDNHFTRTIDDFKSKMCVDE